MAEEEADPKDKSKEGMTRIRKVRKSIQEADQDASNEETSEVLDQVIDSVQEIVEEVAVTAVKEVSARVVGAKGAEIIGDVTEEIVHETGEALQDAVTADESEENVDEVIDIDDDDTSVIEDEKEEAEKEEDEKEDQNDSTEEDVEEDEVPSLKDALAILGTVDNIDDLDEVVDDSDDENMDLVSVDEAEEEEESKLDEDFTLRKLIATLLAKETLPHILLLIVASSVLFVLAKLGDENSELIAIGYISLCIGYAGIAITSGNEKIDNLLRTTKKVEKDSDEEGAEQFQAKLIRTSKSWLKAWILPLLFSGIIFGIMLALFGKDSRMEEVGSMLPLILGGCFILWSITQAISFKNSIVASIKRRTDTSEPIETEPSTFFKTILQMIITLSFSSGLVILFYHYLQGSEGEIKDVFMGEGGIFLAIVFGMLLFMQNTTRSLRIIAGHRKNTSKFVFWWSLILGLFMSWHLLSIYRRVVGADDDMLMIVEEITLMIFTVLMTIWSLSSRGISKGSKIFTQKNALFWGLSFGFGYAGSITMVTVIVGKNVDFVMGIGHGVTLLTLLLLHRIVIKSSLKSADLMDSKGEFLITPKKGW